MSHITLSQQPVCGCPWCTLLICDDFLMSLMINEMLTAHAGPLSEGRVLSLHSLTHLFSKCLLNAYYVSLCEALSPLPLTCWRILEAWLTLTGFFLQYSRLLSCGFSYPLFQLPVINHGPKILNGKF